MPQLRAARQQSTFDLSRTAFPGTQIPKGQDPNSSFLAGMLRPESTNPDLSRVTSDVLRTRDDVGEPSRFAPF